MSSNSIKIFFACIFYEIIFCHGAIIKEASPSTYNTTDSETKSLKSIVYTAIITPSSLSTPERYATGSETKSSTSPFNSIYFKPNSTTSAHYFTRFLTKSSGLTYSTTDSQPKSSSSNSTTSSSGFELTSSTPENYISSLNNSNTEEKDESLATCPIVVFQLGDYSIFPNGTLYVEILNLTLNSSHYIQDEDFVAICKADFQDEKIDEYWKAAHYLLTIFIIDIFVLALSPTYIRIISNGNLGAMLLCICLVNILFHLVRKLNFQTLHLWILLPYVLSFVFVVFTAWAILVILDFLLLCLKSFGFCFYRNQEMIYRVNIIIWLLLISYASITMISTFLDIIGINLSYPGYLDKAMEYLDKSLPAFTNIFTMSAVNILVCIIREVLFEKNPDGYLLDISKWNVLFLRRFFAVISVWIFLAGISIYNNLFATSLSLVFGIILVSLCFRNRDFSEERGSFFSYIPIEGVSRPVQNHCSA